MSALTQCPHCFQSFKSLLRHWKNNASQSNCKPPDILVTGKFCVEVPSAAVHPPSPVKKKNKGRPKVGPDEEDDVYPAADDNSSLKSNESHSLHSFDDGMLDTTRNTKISFNNHDIDNVSGVSAPLYSRTIQISKTTGHDDLHKDNNDDYDNNDNNTDNVGNVGNVGNNGQDDNDGSVGSVENKDSEDVNDEDTEEDNEENNYDNDSNNDTDDGNDSNDNNDNDAKGMEEMISLPSSTTSESTFEGAEISTPFVGDVALKTEASYVRLYTYLSEIKAPLNAFDAILDLLKHEANTTGFDVKAKHPKRKSLVKLLMKRYGDGLEPCRQTVALETFHPRNLNYVRDSAKDTCGVYTYDATAAIKSLLDEADLFTNFSNLAVNPKDPFGRFPKGSPLEESISGSWYQDAYENMLKIFGGTPHTKEGVPVLLFPLCIYLDKTGISILQRHGLEPVMISCLLLNLKARGQTERSWRHLGFIPDLDQKS